MDTSSESKMNAVKCRRCGHQCTSKSNLLQHLRRKKPCVALLEDIKVDDYIESLLARQHEGKLYECRYCDKCFTAASNRCRHEQRCKQQLKETSKSDKEEIKQLKRELDELRACFEEFKGKGSNVTTNNTNNGTINNIVINTIGREDISYITEERAYKNFMVRCIKARAYGLMEFLVRKHFDPKHPENHNIRKLNKKDDFVEVHIDKEWQTRYVEDALDDVFRAMQTPFADFVQEVFTENGVLKKDVLDYFVETVAKPLEWDLDTMDYEYDREEKSEEEKKVLREKICKLAVEHIYKKSQEVHTK